ncbi:MAG TPA: DUF998 domain-containing protein [Thermoleophilia bacterium]|nr:DUF998 domain-containing protein [Thermoleophilia bacterium]
MNDYQVARPSGALSATTSGRTLRLLVCGVVAGPLFVAAALIQALTRAGYDLGSQPISLLSLGELGWVQIATFVVSGLLVAAFAVGARRVLKGSRGGTWGPWLLGAFGVGLIAAGVFVADPSLGFPPGAPGGTPEQLSWHAMLHGAGFMLAMGSAGIACLVFARRDVAQGRRGWAAFALATAATAIALSMWPGQGGASIRYFVAAVIVWAWVSATALRLGLGLTRRVAEPADVERRRRAA